MQLFRHTPRAGYEESGTQRVPDTLRPPLGTRGALAHRANVADADCGVGLVDDDRLAGLVDADVARLVADFQSYINLARRVSVEQPRHSARGDPVPGRVAWRAYWGVLMSPQGRSACGIPGDPLGQGQGVAITGDAADCLYSPSDKWCHSVAG